MKELLSHKKIVLLAIPLFFLATYLFTKPFLSDTSAPQPTTQPANIFPTTFKESQAGDAAMLYNKKATRSLIDRLQNKLPLTQQQASIRTELITTIGGKSGTLYVSPAYRVEYIKSADLFMVEIRDINVDQAKHDATAWFREKGFEQNTLCILPVIFYTNRIVAEQLRPLHMTFDPLPEGCS